MLRNLNLDMDGTFFVMGQPHYIAPDILQLAQSHDVISVTTHRSLFSIEKQIKELSKKHYDLHFKKQMPLETRFEDDTRIETYLCKVNGVKFLVVVRITGDEYIIENFLTYKLIEKLEELSRKKCLFKSTLDSVKNTEKDPKIRCDEAFEMLMEYEKSHFKDKTLFRKGCTESEWCIHSQHKNLQLADGAHILKATYPDSDILETFVDDMKRFIDYVHSAELTWSAKWPEGVKLITVHKEWLEGSNKYLLKVISSPAQTGLLEPKASSSNFHEVGLKQQSVSVSSRVKPAPLVASSSSFHEVELKKQSVSVSSHVKPAPLGEYKSSDLSFSKKKSRRSSFSELNFSAQNAREPKPLTENELLVVSCRGCVIL